LRARIFLNEEELMKIFRTWPLSMLILCSGFLLLAAPGCGGGSNGNGDGETDVSGDDETTADTEDDDGAADGDDTPVDSDVSDPAGDDGAGDPSDDDGPEPVVQYWARTYGGWEGDIPYSLAVTSDGGYIVAGDTSSYGAGDADFWVVKLDERGRLQWDNSYGGTGLEECRGILQTSDGGYAAAGRTESFGVGEGGAMWALKLDASGAVQWQKTYAGGGGSALAAGHGGGVVMGGTTTGFGAEGSDAWVVKVDDSGAIEWQQRYGGAQNEVLYSIQQTSDGGYVFAGWTSSWGAGWADFWVTKVDGSGGVTWSKTYGGADGDDARWISEVPAGGYIVTGWTVSFGAGNADLWLLRLDASGNVQWQNTYGGSADERGFGVSAASDGGFSVAGRTASFGAGNADMWVLRLDSSGAVQWQKTFGSTYDEEARLALELSGGSTIITGKDAFFGTAANDFWVIKTDSTGGITAGCPAGIAVDSSASPAATSVSAADAAVSAAATSASAADTTVSPVASDTDTETQCAM